MELEIIWALHSFIQQMFTEHLYGARDSHAFADLAFHWTGSGQACDQALFQMVAECFSEGIRVVIFLALF